MSSASSLIATARDRRNRRIAAFKRGTNGSSQPSSPAVSRSSSPQTTASETPPASPLFVNQQPQLLPQSIEPTREIKTSAVSDAVAAISARLPVISAKQRSWDVDDAPRPRLSPRLYQGGANLINDNGDAVRSDGSVPVLLKLPDDLLQPDMLNTKKENAPNTTPVRSTTLTPRWSRSLIPPSASTPPVPAPAAQPARNKLSLPGGGLSHGQYASSTGSLSGASETASASAGQQLKASSSHRRSSSDDMSSLGDSGVDDHPVSEEDRHPWRKSAGGASSSSMARMTLALQEDHPQRPSGLTQTERQLWDAFMGVVEKAKQGCHLTLGNGDFDDADPLKWQLVLDQHETAVLADSVAARTDSLTADELRDRMIQQEQKFIRSLRAIQGVLADVTAERDLALQESSRSKTSRSPVVSTRRRGKIVELTSQGCEVIDHRSASPSFSDGHDAIYRSDSQETNTDEAVAQMAKELDEKSLALENAKMIITSLEQASGSLATDLRSKLKAKDDAVVALKADAADKQKRLDSLAMQLRELQRNVPIAHNQTSYKQQSQRQSEDDASRRLTARLEQNMSDLRAHACVMESTGGDAIAMEKAAMILADSISVIKSGVLTDGHFVDAETGHGDAGFDGRNRFSNAVMPSDPRRLHRELEEKTRQLHRMEEAFKSQREETQRLQAECGSRRYNDDDIDSMRQEILSLREQCQTNMEVLAKKERELAVLSDSLKVDDGEVGYISDDASEGSEPGEDEIAPSTSSTSLALTTYGPSQAEALATLLAQGGGQLVGDTQQAAMFKEMRFLHDEMNRARTEAAMYQKQCRVETESLANAKMIISSLEKANKSMMEDLRSRLQDCNTAIASLLEKSMESEKTISSLRQELGNLCEEKQREAEHYEAQINRLRGSSGATFASGSPSRRFSDYKVSVAMETID